MNTEPERSTVLIWERVSRSAKMSGKNITEMLAALHDAVHEWCRIDGQFENLFKKNLDFSSELYIVSACVEP